MTRAVHIRMILPREWQLVIGPNTAVAGQLILITVIGSSGVHANVNN